MPQTLRLRALEAEVDVICPDELLATVRAQWSHCLVTQPLGEAAETIDLAPAYVGEGEEARHRVEYALASQVTYAGIRQQMGRRVMLHAAGVVDPATQSLAILVAESGTGKTTAALNLCGDGMSYLTDETVALDDRHRALAYPKPLSFVVHSGSAHAKQQHGPDELGLTVADDDATARLLVLLDRDPTHVGPPVLEDVPLVEGLLSLVPQTSALPTLEHPLSALASLAVATGGVRRLRYREVTEAIPLLEQALADSTPLPVAPVVHRPAGPPPDPYQQHDPHRPAPQVPADGMLVRGPFTEALEDDDELVVLMGAVPVHLRGPGAVLWLGTEEPQQLATLVKECVRVFGDPGDADSLVRDVATQLMTYGLLEAANPLA
ncbi:hypothetical protein FB554_0073 [Barrientosiimonas humi]|uniref:Coenzyme PQQ synthesis protein D (PqqD) n=1 Tax=Barrientosiimonas humi TaxID=999931 RepID=A0A542X7Z5_9MICO|nr:hypothetical protein [Barrientosiimonas humi]TQL31958.1 hypothetical protein FB554_0073 [Barrientosiimonas humi]CAG7571806.1 hypothetical protein BH39T_PBIAJDOK_00557 [Barrientosiimonas humi]